MRTLPVRRQGKDQKIGQYVVTTDGNRGGFFAGYTKCEHCNADYKVIMLKDDIKSLAIKVGLNKAQRPGWKARMARKILKWAENATMNEATGS